MHTRLAFAVPLSALFASLLSGCPIFGGCGGDEDRSVELTPQEYAQWQMGVIPGESTVAPTTTVDPTATDGGASTGMTDGSSSDGGSSGGSSSDGTTGTGGGASTGGASTGGLLSEQEVCVDICNYHVGGEVKSCSVDEQADKVVVNCSVFYLCQGGRGHACVRPSDAAAGPDAGASWLARIAHDEAASVHAFRALARELAGFGAPSGLLARIEAAALDEVRHAEVATSLARSRGAEPTAPDCVPLPARSLLEVAIENAVEGCVHETWAALAAAHQARRAADPALREVFARIADDEARHAELAWAIDAWLQGQLDDAGRAEVEAARRAAARRLIARVSDAPDQPELLALGLPPARVAAHLSAALGEALWSRAA